MQRVGKQAEALSAKMGAKIGLKVDNTARDKLDKQLRTSLDRELRGEVLLRRQSAPRSKPSFKGSVCSSQGKRKRHS